MKDLDIWYAHMDIETVHEGSRSEVREPKMVKRTEKAPRQGPHQGQHDGVLELTHESTESPDRRRIPLIVPLDELLPMVKRDGIYDGLHGLLRG